MKIFGYILIAFAAMQAYLWIFGVIDLTRGPGMFYFIMIIVEMIVGMLASEILVRI